jgi:hypothetical protein
VRVDRYNGGPLADTCAGAVVGVADGDGGTEVVALEGDTELDTVGSVLPVARGFGTLAASIFICDAAVIESKARNMIDSPAEVTVNVNFLPFRHAPTPAVLATDNATEASRIRDFSPNVEDGKRESPTTARDPKTVKANPASFQTLSKCAALETSSGSWSGTFSDAPCSSAISPSALPSGFNLAGSERGTTVPPS